MVAAAGLTIIDTPVFVIDLRYRRDKNFAANRLFLDRIAEGRGGCVLAPAWSFTVNDLLDSVNELSRPTRLSASDLGAYPHLLVIGSLSDSQCGIR